MSEKCAQCGAVLDSGSCGGICKGCLQPERLEALIESTSLPQNVKDVFLRVGRDFGIVSGKDDPNA